MAVQPPYNQQIYDNTGTDWCFRYDYDDEMMHK